MTERVSSISAGARAGISAAGVLTLFSGMGFACPVLAAEVAEATGIEEVVVSARRRGDESLQNVSIAVTVLSEEDLRKSGITDFSEVASRTPGFTFQEQIGNQQELVIRGIGTLRLTGSAAEPSVGTFIDEVYVGRRGTATPPLFDLERAEVVRGPQGTLYGKNVVGGAINLITGRPSHDSSGLFSLSFGQYDVFGGRNFWEADAHVTGGITDSVAGRLAVHYENSDGYSQNILLGEKLDDNVGYAVRGSLLITPSDALSIHLTADFGHNDGNGQSRRALDDPTVDAPGAVSGSGLLPRNVRESESPWTQWEDRDFFGLTGRVDYTFDSGQTLTYLAAVRDGNFRGRYSLIGTTSPPSLTDAANGQVEEYTGITQDLRLSSAKEASLRWVGGLYFLREDTKIRDRSIATTFLSVLGPGSIGDILDGELLYDQRNVTKSYAGYGEVNWDIRSNLTLTLGGRYTRDHKDYASRSECLDFGAQDDFIYCVAPLGNEFWDFKTDKTWTEFTPKAGLDWRVTEDALLYLSVAKGFKGGGWQGKAGTETAARLPYDPESAWTYEIGAKTEWLDKRLRANVAAFYTKFDNLQVEQLDDAGLTLIIDNAANAKIKGIEVELVARPLSSLQLWFNGSWIDSEYTDFIDSAGNDLSGNTLARTPEFMFSTGVDYSTNISASWLIDARLEYNWQDKMPWLVENTVYEDSYGLVDARIALGTQDGKLEFALYGKNLTDELYSVDQIPFLGDSFARFGPPRSYGLQFTSKF